MLKELALATSSVMQSIMPSGPRMASSSPNMAPWGDFWYDSSGFGTIVGLMGGDEAYEFVSTCFAATRLLCGIGSKMPLNQTLRTAGENGESSSILSKDRRHKMLNFQANQDQTAMSFRSMMVSNQVNRGTAFAEIQREIGSKTAVALWPIHPTRCTAFRNEKDDSLWWNVRNKDGSHTQIPDADMLRIPYTVMARDGLHGVGVSDRANQTIKLGQSLDRAETNASTSNMPRIVVEAEGRMDKPEQDAFRRQWSELLESEENVPALLVGGMKAHALSWNAVDTDHVARREFNIEDIARWYDVPLTLLRRAVKESAGNVEQLGQEFQTYSLAFLEIWEQELGRKLLTEEERDAGQIWDLDYRVLLKADHVGRAKYFSSLFPIGAVNSNQVRTAEGWNPYPQGNQYFVQGAMRPIDEPYSANDPQSSPVDPTKGKADPLKSPKPKAESDGENVEMRCMMLTASRTMLEDCLRRLTVKETKAASRAATKPGEWLTWVESFYADHQKLAAEELAKPLEVASHFGVKTTPVAMAAELCDNAKRALVEAADGDRATFGQRVEALMAEWSQSRAAGIVAGIEELK